MSDTRFSLVPQYSFRELTDVTPDFLTRLGIKFLMLDLDNTIAAYDEHLLSDDMLRWTEEIKSSGIALFIISNSRRGKRVGAFSERLGVGFIMRSRKPSPRGVVDAMDTVGFSPGESALVGDQIFTDTLAANRAGVLSIIVKPRRFTNAFLALRYYLEIPFRALCRNKT